MYIMDNMYDSYVCFSSNMFLAIALGLIASGDWWILFLGLALFAAHAHYTRDASEVGINVLFSKFIKGLMGCDSGVGVDEFLFRTLLSLLGSFVGTIIVVLINDAASGPVVNAGITDG